ncbi:MGDG synthase family glycosyltransferase [Paenibacillus sp. DMB20]|uniref:MGDG synthase family glycosyltransferase n=1 Tax=Paenibacillus sp. DMB20 TaxID=1642570 RepID=UPI0006277BBE|nr:glycosyltransferase [Paenibacillus sp. DMB20]KKO54555.1 diacylglycerol glucosyltransferase [Paenibacillus sp. DMB20]
MNRPSPRILILYASYGSGHLQAAHAIEAQLRRKGVREVLLLDLMAEAHPFLNEMTKFLYMQSFKSFPYLYGWIYDKTKHMKPDSLFGTLLHRVGLAKLSRYLCREEPDLIIHTFPQVTISRPNGQSGQSAPVVTVLTDYDLHGRWLHPGVDRYYVATDDLKREAIERGIPSERIIVSGIPLMPFFDLRQNGQDPEPLDIRLDPGRKTVLLMGGAYGAIQNCMEIGKRLECEPELQTVIICGWNKPLCEQLTAAFKDSPHVHVLGYVERISRLMERSFCMVTKPGGITISECIACGLPLFLYRPVPGQERGNALYLESKGAATISYDPEHLAVRICHLLRNREALDSVKRRIDALSKPHAAETIVDDLFANLLQSKRELELSGV